MTVTREQRRGELLQELEHAETIARALDALAHLIETEAQHEAPVYAYVEVWTMVAARLRRDADIARTDARHYQDRLVDISAAEEAHDRWVPRRA